MGSAEDAQEKQEKRRLVELVQLSSGHVYCMCSEERILSARAGGLGRPGIGCLALLASH